MFLSQVFCEALASTSGAVIELYGTDGSIGAARGAGMGCGLYKDNSEAFAGLRQLRVIETRLAAEKEYSQAFSRWKNILEKEI